VLAVASLFAQPADNAALVRHAPTLNGDVEGSIRQMTAENATLNGGASVTGDLFVPGSPTVRLNGSPAYGGTQDGTGSATPTNHTITLNGGAALRHVVRRTDAIALPVVAAPPQPAGTRSVSLNSPGQSPGDFATLKNLTLNSKVGQIAVPPGTYGNFNANSGSGFTLGVAGATAPAAYNFQNLTLNSNSGFTVVGPVVVTIAGGFSTNSGMGSSAHPEWLNLRIAGGGLSLASNRVVYAQLEAPDGTLTLNGGSQFIGTVTADRLIVNGNSLLRLVGPAAPPNQAPAVALTAPVNGSAFTAPAAFSLTATAADSDGTVAKVEFYQGATKLGEDAAAPFAQAVSGLAAGSYSFTARATDNLGATTASAAVSVTVSAPANQPPTVALTAPVNGTSLPAPATVALAATASDADGTVAKVEFYQGGTKVGEDTTAPYQATTASLAAGSYSFTARATDNQGATTASAAVSVTVSAPANQPPTVALTAPANGSSFTAPAGFTLAATATDADGSVAKVEFYREGMKLGEDVLVPFEFAVSGLAAGTYHYLARATDNAGLAADSPAITVTVVAPNVAPNVTLTVPAEGASFTAPATINLTADAGDSDGTVAKVEFFNGATKLGEDAVAPFEFAWTPVFAGTYLMTARATDNEGAGTTSGVVSVTVTDNTVPFLSNFEPAEGYQPGPLHGQRNWNVLGSAEVVTSPIYAGLQAVSVAPATPPALLVRAFVNSDPGITFVDLFVQPAAGATPAAGVFFETDATRVALTGTSPAGILQAFNGDGTGGGTWFSTTQGPVLDANGRAADWLRLTARSDYGSKKWDLYFNGRMIAADLGFISNAAAAFTGLGLTGHSALVTGFDDLLVAFDNPLFADADHDGMADSWETTHGLNPALNDRDADPDHDNLTNLQEYLLGTNPAQADTDGDRLPDGWEQQHGFDPLLDDSAEDSDHDGLSNFKEYEFGTDARNDDTDGDSLPDALEVALGYDPLHVQPGVTFDADEDGDGLTLVQELQLGTDPRVATDLRGEDTDGDGLSDRWEMAHGLNAQVGEEVDLLNSDADADGLTLAQEAQAGTNPLSLDTDGDGMRDDYEVRHGLNPLSNDAALDPDGDGVNNLEEYRRGTDPTDYFNGVEPEILPFIGGDFDLGADNVLAVRVTDKAGTPLVNAPVIFEVNEGASLIALTPDGPAVGQTAEVRTGAGGIARVFIKAP